LVRLLQSTLKTTIRHLMDDTLVRICTASMPRTSRSPCKRCLSVSVAALARVLSRPVSLGSRKRRGDSEWAFGLNRRISSVCSVAVNFGFHRSTTDRFAIESKTDEFGVGFVGSTEPTEASTEEQINRENGELEKNKSTRKGRRCRALRCPHRRNPARRSRLRALRFASEVPPPAAPLTAPSRCSRRHRFA